MSIDCSFNSIVNPLAISLSIELAPVAVAVSNALIFPLTLDFLFFGFHFLSSKKKIKN